MGQRFEHNGIEYEEMGNGKVRVIGSASTGQSPFTVSTIPLTPEQQAEADRRGRDQQIQEQAALDKRESDERAAREWNATHYPDGTPRPQLAQGYRWNADGTAQEFIPGGPADPARSGKALRQGDSDKLRAAVNQFADMSRVRSNFQKNYGGNAAGGIENWAQGYVSGIGTPGQRDWWSDMAAMDNIIRNDLFGASLTEGEKQAYNRTTITPGMDAREIKKNLARRQDVMRGALQRYIGGLKAGGWNGAEIDALVGDQAPILYPQQSRAGDQKERDNNPAVAGAAPPPPAAPMGSTTQSKPIPPEMQAEWRDYLQRNGGNLDPQAYASFRVGLDQKYGFGQSDPVRYLPEAEQIKAAGANTEVGPIPAAEVPLTGLDKFRNDIVSNPVGAFAVTMGNAGGFGIPGLFAGEQMSALRDANPVSSTLGDIAGGITGAMTGGAVLRGVARIPGVSDDVARLLANPVTADVAYGTVYGATQADDPLYGAVGGAGAALAGNRVGNFIGKRIPSGFGLKSVEGSLNRGERAIYDAAQNTGMDDITAALMRAQDLNVPASLADVSPDINSITGAAVRRSPKADQLVADALLTRGRGQYDRFVSSVGENLGPVSNIPQVSDDLMRQARTAAGPLYDAAYAAPGATALDVADLMQRPSMRNALGRAARLAAEEGRDPATLGFAFDEVGNAVDISSPSWQTLDYMKRALDDVVQSNKSANMGRLDTEGRAANDTLQLLLSRMDAMNPDYAAARSAYAGPVQARSALEAGQEAVRLDPNQLAFDVGNASPSTVDQMRLGFQSELGKRAGDVNYSRNPYESLLGTPAMESRLGTLYGETDEVARLLAQRDMERQMSGATNNILGNSKTAQRLQAQEAFNSDLGPSLAADALTSVVGGVPISTALKMGAASSVGQQFKDRLMWRGIEKADQLAPIAVNTDPAAALASLTELQRRAIEEQAIIDALTGKYGTTGGHIGAGTGSSVAAALMRD